MANGIIYLHPDDDGYGNSAEVEDLGAVAYQDTLFDDAVNNPEAVEEYARNLPIGDFESTVSNILRKHQKENLNLLNYSDPASFVGTNETESIFLKVARARQLSELNDGLAYSRERLKEFYTQKEQEYNKLYLKSFTDSSIKRPTNEEFNQEMYAFGQQLLKEGREFVGSAAAKNAFQEQFSFELNQAHKNLSFQNFGRDIEYYRNSYNKQAESLLYKGEVSGVRVDQLSNEYKQSLDAGVALGVITPEEASKKQNDFTVAAKADANKKLDEGFKYDTTLSYEMNVQKADQQLFDAAVAGQITQEEYTTKLEQVKDKYALSAKETVNKDIISDRKLASLDKAKVATLMKQVNVLDNIIKSGQTPSAALIKSTFDNLQGSPELFKEVVDTLNKAEDFSVFSRLPAEERQRLLNDPSDFMLENYADYKAVHEKVSKSSKEDPVTTALNQGIVDITQQLSMDSSSNLLADISYRASMAPLIQEYYGQKNVGLTNNEIEQIGKYINDLDLDEQSDFLDRLYAIYNQEDLHTFFKGIDKKGLSVLALAGDFRAAENSTAAHEILSGKKVLEKNPSFLPGNNSTSALTTKFLSSGEDAFELPVFADDWISGKTRQDFIDSVKYIYASLAFKNGKLAHDKDESADAGLMQKATEIALQGRLIEYGQAKILSPALDVDELVFSRTMSGIDMTILNAIGGLQDVSGNIVDNLSYKQVQDLLESSTLITIGNGKYYLGKTSAVEITNSPIPNFTVYKNRRGQPLIIDFNQLRQAVNSTKHQDNLKAQRSSFVDNLVSKTKDALFR